MYLRLLATITSFTSSSASPSFTAVASYSNGSSLSVCHDAIGLNAIYSGYSTDPALQCLCISRYVSWYETTDPATREYTTTIGVGAITSTITTGGSTFVTSYANLTTYTATAVGNNPGADGFNWYGTAEPPCVCT